jgi:predicted O-methyltransferase YrrM
MNPARFSLPYQEGRNLLLLAEFLDELARRGIAGPLLLRASESLELDRILTYGTDRGGFPEKVAWRDGTLTGREILHEDVVFGTTAEEIRLAERDAERSSSFKKLPGITDPILLAYDAHAFEKIADRQHLFRNPAAKRKALLAICKLDKLPAIQGWFSEAAGLAYRALVASIRGGSMVEIGCWRGLSTSYVARLAAAQGTRLVCVDAWDGSTDDFDAAYRAQPGAAADFEANMHRLGLQVEIRRARSPAAAKAFADLDLVFLDASHDEAGVAADLAGWSAALKPRGVLAGHDFTPKHPGVIQAVTRFAAERDLPLAVDPSGVWSLRW